MTPDLIFQLANSVAPLAWTLLVFAPRWKWTHHLIISGAIPLLLGLVYFMLIVLHFGDSEGDFGSLAGVQALFQNPYALVAGWIHYLAFDLFIGSWEVRNSQAHGISHWLVIPCLLLTFFFGPIGVLLYFIIRWWKTRQLLHENFNVAR